MTSINDIVTFNTTRGVDLGQPWTNIEVLLNGINKGDISAVFDDAGYSTGSMTPRWIVRGYCYEVEARNGDIVSGHFQVRTGEHARTTMARCKRWCALVVTLPSRTAAHEALPDFLG